MNLGNYIRFYNYISAVLVNQQADPLCRKCKALVNSVSALRESLKSIRDEHSDELKTLPEDTLHLYAEAVRVIGSINTTENAEGQKSAGNCKMPKGVCFVKSSKALLKNI